MNVAIWLGLCVTLFFLAALVWLWVTEDDRWWRDF